MHIIFFFNIVLISNEIVDDVVEEDGQLLGGLEISLKELEKEFEYFNSEIQEGVEYLLGGP